MPSGNSWTANEFCEKCEPILRSRGRSVHQHLATSREIRDSAYRGCHLCSLIHGAFPLVRRENSQPSSEVQIDGPWEVECSFDDDLNAEQCNITAYVSGRKNQSLHMKLNAISKTTLSVNSAIKLEEKELTIYGDSTGGIKSLKIASHWLETCLNNHETICGVSNLESKEWLPTRLLYIDGTSCRILESKEFERNIKYLILSYCWGTEQQGELKLTHKNYQQLRVAIDFDRFPQTIAEAVVTTKKLGYDYLWVDRLCIIQGDDKDWEFEAQRMQAYYMLADCSIATLIAGNVHQGMYTRRNPLLMQPLRVQSPRRARETQVSSVLGGAAGHYPRMYRGPPYVLSERAWILQERLLAPRTLYFGSLMLYWECRRARFAENDPHIDLDLPFASLMRKFGSRAAMSSAGQERIENTESGQEDLWMTPTDGATIDNMQDKWADMVERYTKCSMTYPAKDRLLAITGMINSITARTGQRFIHGMLASRLPTELLWWQWVRCEGDISVRPQRLGDTTKTPTWSWASVKGDVQPFWCWRFIQQERRNAWQIEIDASTQNLDVTIAKFLTWTTNVKTDSVCEIKANAPVLEICIGDRVDNKHYCWTIRAVVMVGVSTYRCFLARIWPDEVIAKGQTVWLLRAAAIIQAKMSETCLAGLVIVPVSSYHKQYWRRVGYWHSDSGISDLPNPSEDEKASAHRTIQLIGHLSFTPLIYLL